MSNFLHYLVALFEKYVLRLPKYDCQIYVPEPPKPVPKLEPKQEEKKRDLITELCLAIRDYEGKPGDLNYRNNNPGNVRGTDGKFLKFATYEAGLAYLKEYVKRAATGKHRAYKPDMTLVEFFSVYAPVADANQPDMYAAWVGKRLGVDPRTFKIKDVVS